MPTTLQLAPAPPLEFSDLPKALFWLCIINLSSGCLVLDVGGRIAVRGPEQSRNLDNS